jgi:hypothetical protein
MRLVLTLVVRDEADIVEANIAFHLNAGVSFVVAMDNGSQDGTLDVLRAYEREGYLHLVRDPRPDLKRGGAQTALARRAATEFDADWVITADADQFYWPRVDSLDTILAAVPPRYGVLTAPRRVFVPRPAGDSFFAERMTLRVRPAAAIHDPVSLYRPQANAIHRAHGSVVVAPGNRGAWGVPGETFRGWHPIEVLHFPLRSLEQCERKYVRARADWLRNAVRARAVTAHAKGSFHDYYAQLVVDDETAVHGLASGALVEDTRLRDALRALRAVDAAAPPSFSLPAAGTGATLRVAPPTLREEAEFAHDVAVLEEADTVRLRRALDELERRVATLERGTPNGLRRRTRELVLERARSGS